MKIISGIFIFIAMVVAITMAALLLATFGGTSDVGEYSFSIVIKTPPDKLYPYLLEYDKRRLWKEGLTEQTVLTKGEAIYGGSRAEEKLSFNGKNMTMEYEVIKRSTNSLTVRYTSRSFSNTVVYDLKNENDNTRLTVNGSLKYSDPFGTLFSPLTTGTYKKQVEDELKELKRVAEADNN